ncbi:hypothetical protein ACX80J_09995 [Arthrobacter sp. MDB2-24]
MPARQYAPGSADPSGPVGRPAPEAAAGLAAALPERGRIKARGVIDRITIAPVTSSPSFTVLARIDWNGAEENVRIVWMGQRRVPGIEAGVSLRFEGMLSRVDGTPTVYNPRYEIIGRPEEY